MHKIKIFYVVLFVIASFLFFQGAAAKAAADPWQSADAQKIIDSVFGQIEGVFEEKLPEFSGIFDVPNRPDLKLGVIVHDQKPDKSPSHRTAVTLTCSDPNSSSSISRTKWRLPNGTWTYTLNPSSVPSTVGESNLAGIVQDAFSRWSGATSGKVMFAKNSLNTTKNRASLDGKNIIAWGSAPSNALGVTYTWYQTNTGLAVETDTIMNKRFSWSWSNPFGPNPYCDPNSYDAQNILTHELGHWMGLADMYATSYKDATMYGYGSKAEIKKDTLTTGDISGIQAIY